MGDHSTEELPAGEEEEIDYDNPPFPLTAIDRELLAMRDEDFHETTWEDIKHIIATNALETLHRRPSDLHRYITWSARLKTLYPTLTAFILSNKLFWKPLDSKTTPPEFHTFSPKPLEDERDYAILLNDWPYGFEKGVRHLIVWSKLPFDVITTSSSKEEKEGEVGDLTAQSRREIEEFVQRVFRGEFARSDSSSFEGGGPGGGEDRVVWFKNWVALQSVRGLDHVHVIVRGATEEMLAKWTTRRDLMDCRS